jgi:hypothetical protein
VEDAVGALDRQPHGGGRVEQVHLEQPETRARAVLQGPQVLRLALVLCKKVEGPDGIKLANLVSSRSRVQLMSWACVTNGGS